MCRTTIRVDRKRCGSFYLEEADEAFKALKEKLTTSSVLTFPNVDSFFNSLRSSDAIYLR